MAVYISLETGLSWSPQQLTIRTQPSVPFPLWGLNPGVVKAMGIAFMCPHVVEFSLVVCVGARAKVSEHPTHCAYILTS